MLALLIAAALAAAAAPPHATVVVLPFSSPEAVPWTGLAVAESVIDFIAQVNRDNFVTLKQLDAALRPRKLTLSDAAALAANADALAQVLGATDVIVGQVDRKGDIWTIDARRLRVPGGALVKQSTVQGSRALLPLLTKKLAGELLAASTKVPPPGKDQRALDEAAHCGALLARQSLSPRAKAVLDDAEVREAAVHCKKALEIDPALGLARAGFAVALAVKGRYDDARSEARKASESRFVPLAVLAEAFALRRSGDSVAARGVLDGAVAARPGFLHALGYLGEDRLEGREYALARVEFERYLKRAPGHPWAEARLGHTLARLGKKAEAIQLTKAVLDRHPGDPELHIELASRLIDDGKDAEAEPHLKAALEAKPPRAMAGLRLGYLYLRGKRLPEAKDLFNRVVAASTRTDESRLRAVAQADLARVAAMQGSFDEAVQHLGAARDEGMRKLPCEEPSFAQWKDKPELIDVCKEPKGRHEPFDENEPVPVDF